MKRVQAICFTSTRLTISSPLARADSFNASDIGSVMRQNICHI